ncbi:MAG: hypothetical protein AMS26_17505 [Bacteroides sp. SM23_62]|nr:MAG: hypothetical protein AMS26_17505 [Bacteroides sp. SM23_62]
MKVKSYIKALLVFFLITLAGSCNEYLGLNVNCDDCWGFRPDSADLIIHVTIDGNHPEVPIVLYRGNVENGQVDYVDTARQSPYTLYSAIDQYYSVTAEYKVDGKTIIAVDGDVMKAKDATASCEFECWIVTDGEFRVDLK